MAIVNSHFATVQAKEGEDSAQLLADIEGVIGQCRRCALCEGRTNVVPGFGNPAARVMQTAGFCCVEKTKRKKLLIFQSEAFW